MKITNVLKKSWICGALLLAGLTVLQAQTIFNASWTGTGGDGLWGTAANWSTGVVPGADANGITNALIGSGNTVNFNASAAYFGLLTNNGTLNVNSSGLSCISAVSSLTAAGAKVLINGGGGVTVSNVFGVGTNGVASLASSASLSVSNLIVAYNLGNNTISAFFTNNGGTLAALKTTLNNGGTGSGGAGTATPVMVINGGINNLGTTLIGRSHATSLGSLGSDGLVINGGTVIMTNLTLSGPSVDTAYIAGGTVTNFGNVSISGFTANRAMRVAQSGGLFVVADPNIIYLNPAIAGLETARYQVTGGTNIIGGMIIGNTNDTLAARATTVTVTVGGSAYVGSQGIALGFVTNTTSIACSSGGLFGATANWIGAAPMTLGSGTPPFTFKASDLGGTPHNITLNTTNILSGSGGLNKTGGGTLLLSATNTYSGVTLVNGGSLVLDVNGFIAKSTKIIVGSGSTFDVSAVTGGFVLTNQTLSGSGGVVTGAVSVASGATIDPGSNTITGTLIFSNSVAETQGGVTNHFDLAGAPNPNNDLVIVAGDLNVSGTNTVDILGGSLVIGTNYVIFQYGGNFNGDITNFVVTTAVGTLTNDPVAKTISFVPQTTLRGATNTVWIGNPVNTNWDNQVSTNWLIASSSVLDFFVPGDSVKFTDAGASNSPVNIVGVVQPTSILVNSQSNYVFASTSGGLIGGTASLTVTNTGTLTILTTNTYTGTTTVDGGASLNVSKVANISSPSAVGVSDSLVISNGTFIYSGLTASIDRGATLGNASSAISVSANGNLTLSGLLGGGGGLTKIGNGTLILSSGNSYGGGTFVNTGTLTLNDAGSAGAGPITLNGGTLAIGAVKPANTVNVAVTSVVQGGNNGGLTGIRNVTGSADFTIAVGTQTNSVFDLTGDMTAYSGTITFSNIDTGICVVRFNGATGSALATWDLGVGPTMDLNVRTSSALEQLGALKGAAGTTLSGRGGSSNSGSTGYAIGANGQSTTFNGVIQNGFGASGSVPNANSPTSITKVGSGTLSLSGTSIYTGNTTVSNGVLALIGSGSIANSSIINIISGAFLDVSGRGDGTLTLGSGQQLRGNGTILGILNGGSGIVSPGGGTGGSIGTLTANNTINLVTTTTTSMKVNRNGGSPVSDRLVSSLSAINYNGILVVTNIGATLQVNDTFTLFNGTSYSGSFSSIQPASASWDTSQLNVNGSIRFLGYLTPGISKVDFSDLSNGNITIYATNGPPNGNVNFLVSTNIALPVSQWAIVDSTGLFPDGSLGPFGYTFVVDQTKPQLFIILQEQ